ncbi:MAG: PAS domain S-box protein [Thermaurantimonas sp.]|uniref:PAS domain S-box protein n=1 Tax=Thermaurantimonas sp. TaxID=2681568 RepID=UPI003919AB22
MDDYILKRSKSTLYAIVNQAHEIIHCNEAFKNYFQLDENFFGKIQDLFVAEEQEKLRQIVLNVLQNDEHYTNLKFGTTSESFGQNQGVNWELYRINCKEENCVFLIGSLLYTNEHILLTENLKKLEAILTSTNESSIILSKDNRVEYFSAQAYKEVRQFFGKEIKVGDDFDQYIIPDLRELFYEKFNDALSGKEIFYEINIPVGGSNGLWFFVKFVPVRSSDGTIGSVLYSARNINDIKQYESELTRQKFYLKSMYESTDTAIAIFDRNLKMIYANKRAFELTEIKFGRKIRQGDFALEFIYLDNQDYFKNQIDKALQGETVIFEFNDGDEFWKFKIFPILDENNNNLGISIHISDITAIKNYEKKIIEQAQFLKKLAWSQSHELRGPLSTILAISENINDIEEPDLKEIVLSKLRKYADQMDQIVKSTVNSINQISEKYGI